MKFYAKVDADSGQVQSVPSPETAEGLTEIEVPLTSKEYFVRWYNGYAWKNDRLIAPGWAPNVDIDYLQSSIDDLGEQVQKRDDVIQKQGDQLDAANAVIQSLQKTAGTIGGQQAKLSLAVETANKTIESLQAIAGSLGGQLAKLQLAKPTTTTTSTSTSTSTTTSTTAKPTTTTSTTTSTTAKPTTTTSTTTSTTEKPTADDSKATA